MSENNDPRVIDAIKYATGLAESGEVEAAADHLVPLIDEVPMSSSLHAYSAMFLSRVGRLEEAIKHGQQAVRLSPSSEKASFVLFEALCKSEHYIEALDEMKRLLVLRDSEEYTKTIREWNLSDISLKT